ncbi:MAG: hypothetical protein JXO22_01820 [Phycisphaerae bacterium]|nr:hypothetical protein [Phycisphaerae bacterium]
MRRVLDFLKTGDIPASARPNFIAELQFFLLWVVLGSVIDFNLIAIVAKKTFHATDGLTTLIWAIPILGNIFNMFWGVLLRGRRRVPAMITICAGISLLVGSIAFTPHTLDAGAPGEPASQTGAWIFALQLAGVYVLMSGLVTLRVSLWQVNYPASHRAQVAGRFQIARLLATFAIPISLGLLYDYRPDAYRYVHAAAALIGLAALWPLARIRVTNEEAENRRLREHLRESGADKGHAADRVLKGVADSVRILRDDPPYRNYLTAQFLLGSANFFTEPILILIVTQRLGLGYFWSVFIMTMVKTGIMLVVTPAWSRFFDRVGIFRFRIYNSAFWCVSYVLVAAAMIVLTVSGDTCIPLVIGLIVLARMLNGLGAAGGMLAWPLGHLAFAREHQANLYLGIHVALTGVRGLLAPQVALQFFRIMGNTSLSVAVVLSLTGHIIFRRLKHHDRHRSAKADVDSASAVTGNRAHGDGR